MSHTESWIAVFACLFSLTVYFSYIGDDDVVYQYLRRKPTPKEGVRRTRWVLLKAFTSIYGGLVLAAAVQKLLLQCCSIALRGNPSALTAFACMILVGLLIGVLQNGIRRLRNRPTRPLLDPIVWRRSFGKLEGHQPPR